jgi:hypothetical protein
MKHDAYIAQPGDLILHTYDQGGAQHIYRVTAIYLGELDQEGVVELEPVSHKAPSKEVKPVAIMVPHVMFDKMVRAGCVQFVWRRLY